MIHREPTNPSTPERPPYRYVTGDADVRAVFNAAGLASEIYANQEFLESRGIWELTEIFSEGELRLVDLGNLSDPGQLRESGANRGEFYDRMTQLLADSKYQNGPAVDDLNKLARICGETLATRVEQGDFELPITRTTRPSVSPFDGSTIVQFDQYVWKSPGEVPTVVEYGPGVIGKKFLDAQLKALDQGIAPFQYIGVSDGPFVNQFLNTYLRNNLSKRFEQTPSERAIVQGILNSGRLFTGREDGMLQATQSLLATPQPDGMSEVSDLILLTGVQGADPRELEATIKLSSQILKSHGKLMLSAPLDQENSEYVAFQDQLRWAEEAGYVSEWQNIIPTGDSRLGTATISGLAVLRK